MNHRISIRLLSAALTLVVTLSSAASAQQIQLTLQDGRVTLDASNASPAAILAEWARVGNTRVVDAERMTGEPLTLKLEGVTEREALDIILRSAAGYIAAARPAGIPGVSSFDRIVVMPVSANAASAQAGPAPMAPPVAMQPQVFQPLPAQADAAVDAGIQADADMVVDDGTGAEVPVSSTEFDYANPQRYFAARAAQQRAVEAAQQGEGGTGDANVQEAPPVGPGGFSTGTVLSSPGTIPTPEPGAPGGPAPRNVPAAGNPYGLPADAAPGSSTAPPMAPDRSKYINPYSPTPPPPGQ